MSKRINIKSILIFAIALSLPFGAWCQIRPNHLDNHRIDESDINRLKYNKQLIVKNGIKPRGTTYLPIKYHLVADSFGKNQADISILLDQLCHLNKTFEQVDVQFFLKGDFNYIWDTRLMTDPQEFISYPEFKQQYDSSSINIVLLKPAIKLNAGYLGGFYAKWTDVICITQGVPSYSFQYALPGRMGYYFSLPNTSNGIPIDYSVEEFGNPVFSEYLVLVGDTIRLEAVNGSNCNVTGDFICDTPPDYRFDSYLQNKGIYCEPFYQNYPILDFNLDTIKSPYNNIMSTEICEKYKISPTQGQIIDVDINERSKDPTKKGYLDLSLTPPPIIIDFPDIVYPEDQTALSSSGFITFSWSAVPGATSYYFQISWLSGTSLKYFILPGNTLSFVLPLPLESNRFYRWKVIPFNASGFCDPNREDGWKEFTTGDQFITSAHSINASESAIKAINPIVSGNPISLFSNKADDFAANIELYNNQGLLVYIEKNILFVKGHPTLLKHHALTQGVYYVNIKSEKLFQTIRIVVTE